MKVSLPLITIHSIIIKKFLFCFLGCNVMVERLWLLNSDIHWTSFILFNVSKYLILLKSEFIFISARLEISVFEINNNQTFISQDLTILGLLRENFIFSIPWHLKLKWLWLHNLQNKVTLNQSFKSIAERQESDSWSRDSIDFFILSIFSIWQLKYNTTSSIIRTLRENQPMRIV